MPYILPSTPDLQLVRTAAKSKWTWKHDTDFRSGMLHGLTLSLIAMGWHSDTAAALIANAEFCFTPNY